MSLILVALAPTVAGADPGPWARIAALDDAVPQVAPRPEAFGGGRSLVLALLAPDPVSDVALASDAAVSRALLAHPGVLAVDSLTQRKCVVAGQGLIEIRPLADLARALPRASQRRRLLRTSCWGRPLVWPGQSQIHVVYRADLDAAAVQTIVDTARRAATPLPMRDYVPALQPADRAAAVGGHGVATVWVTLSLDGRVLTDGNALACADALGGAAGQVFGAEPPASPFDALRRAAETLGADPTLATVAERAQIALLLETGDAPLAVTPGGEAALLAVPARAEAPALRALRDALRKAAAASKPCARLRVEVH